MIDLKMQFPKNFFEAQERDGYLVSVEKKKVWAVLFDLLNEFRRVCEKYDIRYWIDAGTLLGAVRHGGMIPWDDDIDLIMMRDQYEKLCDIAPVEFCYPYFFQTEKTDKGTARGLAQLRNDETTAILQSVLEKKYQFHQGIFIDIFPLDTIPDEEKKFDLQKKNVEKYRRKLRKYKNWTYCYKYDGIKNYIGHLLAKKILKKKFDYTIQYEKFELECKKYFGTKSRRVCKLVLGHQNRRVWQRSWFDETVYLPFEWFELPAPKEYEKLLDVFYGDWHTEKKGESTHGECFFDVEKSYREYIK